MTLSINITGCKNQAKKTGSFIDISYETMVKKMENRDTFILQFTKKSCPYCISLEEVEQDYLSKNNIKIYRFYTDSNIDDYQSNIDFFHSKFADFEYVPTVYWIEKGKPMNQLPIIEEAQYDILEKWVEDNKEYY